MELNTFAIPVLLTLLFSSVTAVYYYKNYLKRDVAMTIVLYSVLVFSIVFFVSFEGNIGLGIGLLGILSLIRLRTTLDNLVDIGFVFYGITLGLLNASMDLGLALTAGVDVFLTVLVCVLGSSLLFHRDIRKMRLTYDHLDIGEMDNGEALRKRVEKDLNLPVIDARVTRVNQLRDSVTVQVTYEYRNATQR